MKTFVVLFLIATSLPSEAQRVTENVRQRVEIVEDNSVREVASAVDEKEVKKDIKKDKVEPVVDASHK